MGVQSEILSGYRAIQSANNVPKFVNASNARADNMSFVNFIFELLKMTKGRDGFDNIVLKGILTDLKNSINVEDEIKKIIKEFLMCNVSIPITLEMTTAGPGVDIIIPEIDPFNLLSVDPNSKMGKYYYEGNDPNKDINYIFYKALSATKEKPLQFKKNDVVLFSLYSPTPNTINFSFGSAYQGKFFDEWVTDYLADMKFFNIPNFFSMLVDIITGALSVKAGKNQVQIEAESKLIAALKKIFGYCSDDTGNANDPKSDIPNADPNFDITGDNYTKDLAKNGFADGNPFDFSNDELYDISDSANKLANNLLKFQVCSPLLIPVDADEVLGGIDNILLENQTDAINEDGANVYDNENSLPNVDAIQQFLNSFLVNGVKKAAEEDGSDELLINIPNIKLEFELNILKQIPYAIMKTIINPKLFVLFKAGGVIIDSAKANFNTKLATQPEAGGNSISIEQEKASRFKIGDVISFLGNGSTDKDVYTVADIDGSKLFLNRPLSSAYDQRSTVILNISFSKVSLNSADILNQLKNVLKSVGAVVTDKILKNIYTMIKDELTKIALEMLKKALMQRFKDYISVLESLLSLLRALDLFKKEKCSSILSKILKLLKINLPIPAIPMPPMITLIAGALKPGMNEVVAINQMKSKLEQYGINTSQVNADGSPNAYILGLETVMSTMISHIKTSANIQTEIISAVGPGKGFSQIQ